MRQFAQLILFVALLRLPLDAAAQLPDYFSSLALWVRADSNVSILSGTLVQQWGDMSGNGRNLGQTSPGAMPQLAVNALNGRNVINFTGVSHNFAFESVPDVRTVVWVLREDPNYGASNQYRHFLGNANSDPYFRGDNRILWRNPTAHPDVINGQTRLGFEWLDGSATTMNNDWNIMALVTAGPLPASFFGRSGGFAGFWKGQLAELLIFTEPLTEAQIEDLEGMLLDYYTTPLNLGDDIVVEEGFCPTELSLPPAFSEILWSTGESASSIQITGSQSVWVQAKDELGRMQYDTLTVTYPGNTVLPESDTICLGETLTIDLELSEANYVVNWSNGTESPVIDLTEPGSYSFTVVDGFECAFTSDQLVLSVDSFSVLTSLGPDRDVCAGNVLAPLPSGGGIESYLWDDGSTSPQITITESGTYTLEAINSNGCVLVDEVVLTVAGVAPTVSVNAPALACVGTDYALTLDITADSQIEEVVWQFPFGTATGETVDFTPELWGNTTVVAAVTTAAGCTGFASTSIDVQPLPTGNITFDETCTGNSMILTTQPQIAFGTVATAEWSFAGETQLGNLVAFVPEDPGFQQIQLTLTSAAGCANTFNQLVQVRQSPEFEVVAPVTCQGDLTSLSTETLVVQEGSITNYTWTFGDNTGSNQAAPVHLYPNPGTYLVTCTMVSSFGCIGVDQAQVLVVAPPQPDFTVANACVGTPFAFENLTVSDDPPADFVWTIGTIDQVFGESPSYVFASSGTVPVNLSVVTENGCEGSITRQVPVFDPPLAACTANPIIGAPPLDVDFAYTGSSANSFSWSINGEPAGESGALTATFNEEGSYTATVVSTNAEGCSASASITVLADQPVLDLVLTDFQVDEDGDGWSATVAFANAGNFSPTELSIRLSTADGNAITESPELIPQPGNGTVYSFAARLSPGRNGANYLCIELVPTSSLAAEATPANNRYCIAVSETFSFGAPYPNPSPAGTEPRVRFTLPEAEEARIRILDATGREVSMTESTRYPSGYNEVVLSGIQPPPGQYIIEFLGERHREIRRWQVLR